MGNRKYIIRKFTEKTRQEYRCRCDNKFTEKPRQQYRYVKPHPSTRFRKETYTAEKTNIENTENTNYQKRLAENLAEITSRLELIEEEILKLKKNITRFEIYSTGTHNKDRRNYNIINSSTQRENEKSTNKFNNEKTDEKTPVR